MLKQKLTTLATTSLLGVTMAGNAMAAGNVNFYNWSDYIAEETLPGFTEKTGINVKYDVFDSNEVLEAKLLAGSSGYDVVVPSASFMGKQITAGAYQKLDKSKLTNWDNLNPVIMKVIETIDPGNQYSVPYLWGTTGIGYNPEKVAEVLGEDAPTDSWDLVFKPENLAKLNSCGVAFLDAPAEVIPAALHYLGLDPNSENPKDYEKSEALLSELAPHITYFHSSRFISDLANGDICVAVGWSGDILQAATRAEEAANGVEVAYTIPKEGAGMWFDMLTIPADASNVDEAHQLINYLMDAEVIAGVSNYVWYANGNSASTPLIDEEVTGDPSIYPTPEVEAKLYTFKVLPRKIDRIVTRSWQTIKSGN
ncbi:polyamine ABC transporter substrate-binding protein [Marinobacter sp. F4216]|nr:polyamine ABC transporter substrate-binding protein [Marinobacter sp. F4216]